MGRKRENRRKRSPQQRQRLSENPENQKKNCSPYCTAQLNTSSMSRVVIDSPVLNVSENTLCDSKCTAEDLETAGLPLPTSRETKKENPVFECSSGTPQCDEGCTPRPEESETPEEKVTNEEVEQEKAEEKEKEKEVEKVGAFSLLPDPSRSEVAQRMLNWVRERGQGISRGARTDKVRLVVVLILAFVAGFMMANSMMKCNERELETQITKLQTLVEERERMIREEMETICSRRNADKCSMDNFPKIPTLFKLFEDLLSNGLKEVTDAAPAIDHHLPSRKAGPFFRLGKRLKQSV